MKKTIIANWGPSNQGKTDTIKRLAQLILDTYPHAKCTPAKPSFKADIVLIIMLGKIRIGIESQGDPNSRLPDSLKYFSEEKCDIIVCATRTSGQTVEEVNALNTSHGYDTVWVTNHRSPDKDISRINQLSANHILDLMQRILDDRL